MINISQLGLTFSDGDEWEEFCQSCLKIKFQHSNFKSVPADSCGDYGLDGFDSTGEVFQCYCPEKEYTDKELYEHQRIKVTTDVQKLKTYSDKLRTILNGVKIKKWNFTTPLIKSKELILHCNEKENLVKSWGLDFIDDSFQIGLKDYEYFLPEIPFVLSANNFIRPDSAKGVDFEIIEPTEDEILAYKTKYNDNEFVNNALRKNKKLFPENGEDFSDRVIKMTDSNIESSIIGETIMKHWSDAYDKQYERFIRVIKSLERKIQKESLFPVEDNLQKLKEIKSEVKATLDKEFPYFLSEGNKVELTESLVADWILKCSLDFN